MTDTGIVKIHGREYKTVALRVQEFRAEHPIGDGWAICTEEKPAEDGYVKMAAAVLDPEQRIVATGIAEERRGSSAINRTSALENCETSAIGRALAAAGYGGSEYCSADELAEALAQQLEAPDEPLDLPPSTPERTRPREVALPEIVDKLIETHPELCATWEPDEKMRRRAMVEALESINSEPDQWIDDFGRTDMNRFYIKLKERMSLDVDRRIAERNGD